MKVGAFDHPKIFHLAHLLQTDRWQARGLVESIFIVTGQFAIRGNIGHLRNQAIACKIDYKGDADHMVRCLVDSGWVDEHPEHRLVVHNWHKHCSPWVKGSVSQMDAGFVGNGPSSDSSLKRESPIPLPIPLPGKDPLRNPLGTPKEPLRKPDQVNQKKPPPPPPRGESAGGESFEDIIGPPFEDVAPPCPAHSIPPEATRSPKTNPALPEVLRTDGFREAWRRWAVHRTEIRKKLTPSTTASQLKKLAKWGETVAVASIEQSIENGYTGLFEPKETDRGKPTRPDIDAASVRRAAQRAREHPEGDKPIPRIDFTTRSA